MSRHARFHAITLHVWYILNIISSHLSTEQPKSGFYSIVGPSHLLSLKIRCSEMGTILNIISRYNLVCDTTGNLRNGGIYEFHISTLPITAGLFSTS